MQVAASVRWMSNFGCIENRLDYRSVGQAVPDSPGVNDCRSDVLLTSG